MKVFNSLSDACTANADSDTRALTPENMDDLYSLLARLSLSGKTYPTQSPMASVSKLQPAETSDPLPPLSNHAQLTIPLGLQLLTISVPRPYLGLPQDSQVNARNTELAVTTAAASPLEKTVRQHASLLSELADKEVVWRDAIGLNVLGGYA